MVKRISRFPVDPYCLGKISSNVKPLSNVKEKEANPTAVFMVRLKKQKFLICITGFFNYQV
jgi:hypothetical protein